MCTLTPPISTQLPINARAVAQSRTLLWTYGCAAHNEASLDKAELMLWELVTSAITHDTPPLLLKIECTYPDSLQVHVAEGRDDDRGGPLSDDPVSGWGARGIALIDLLSDAWGMHQSTDTVEVWFQLNP